MSDELNLKRRCLICGKWNSGDVKTCQHCDSLQYKRHCTVCGKNLPFGATYCTECKSYQGLHRYFGMSQIVLVLCAALLTVLIPTAKGVNDFVTRDSETTIALQSFTSKEIVISAINKGRSPSLLREFHLISGNPAILNNAELELVANPETDPKSPGNVVPANGGLTIRLKTSGLDVKVARGQLEIGKLRQMKIEVDVLESDGSKTKPGDSFPAIRIEAFILGNALYKSPNKEAS
jgi:hypothetical protein